MLEAELVNSLNNYLYTHGICYSNEIRMGIGIPDISFNIGGNKRIKFMDDYYLFSVWDYVNERGKTTLEEIGKRFLFSMDKVKRYVFQLVKMSLLAIKDEIVRVINSIKDENLGTTVSIEAKISDWKNGLIQAQRYLLFSDYSFLVLPEKNIKHVNTELFKEAGIGLLSVADNDINEVILARKSNKCEYYLKYMYTSVLFNRYKKDNSKYIRKKTNIFTKYMIEC